LKPWNQVKASDTLLGAPNLSLPQRLRLGVEDQRAVAGEDVPRAEGGLAVELSGAPAGVAQIHAEPLRSGVALQQLFEWLARRDELNVGGDRAAVLAQDL
jgi:hypothetical protein